MPPFHVNELKHWPPDRYLELNPGITYTAWFGPMNAERYSNVSNVFNSLQAVIFAFGNIWLHLPDAEPVCMG